ncbi:MAG: hypothetical protein AAB539_04665 [Patescibacteria group bacterium]
MELLTQLGIDWKLLAAQMLNFGILIFVLHRFLYKPVLGILEKRRIQIQENDHKSQELEDKIGEADAAYRKSVARADEQATRIVADATARAAKEKESIMDAARIETQKIHEDAERRNAREREDFLRALTTESKAIIRASVEKIFTAVADTRLTEQLLKKAEREIERI